MIMFVAVNVKILYCMLIMKFGLSIQVSSTDDEYRPERPVARTHAQLTHAEIKIEPSEEVPQSTHIYFVSICEEFVK